MTALLLIIKELRGHLSLVTFYMCVSISILLIE